MRGMAHSLVADDLVGVADSAHGFTGSDLRAVCMLGKIHTHTHTHTHTNTHILMHTAQHRALSQYLENGAESRDSEGVLVRSEDVRGALREVRPSAMREVTLEVPKV